MPRMSISNLVVDVDDYGNPTLLQTDELTPVDGVGRELVGATVLAKADINAPLRFNAGAPAQISIDSDEVLQLRPGKSTIRVYIAGAGVPTFAAVGGSGVTIVGGVPAGLAQHSFVVLVHTGIANRWAYA